MRRAEPDDDARGQAVDALHHPDLGGAFGDVGLVDAEGIDPEGRTGVAEPVFVKDGAEVGRYGDHVVVTDERAGWGWRTPDVGEGMVVVRELK